jgi:RimJ/RimL family protein N-acetyltransferase
LIEPPLVTERLLLRPMEPGDEEAFHAIWSARPVLDALGEPGPWSRRATRDRLARKIAHQAAHGFGTWAVCEREGGRLVGEGGLQYLENGPEIEVGWRMAPAVWGRGYATEAARAWLDAGLRELALDRVVAVVEPDNVASRRVAEKAGMTRAGTGRHYGRAVVVYERRS